MPATSSIHQCTSTWLAYHTTALQEAQQDTVSAFETYMDDCMARDWAANKRQLFGLIAPHSGAAMTVPSGPMPLIGTPLRTGAVAGAWGMVLLMR